MPTTPATVPTLPTAPDPNDRSTFNSRAYPWSAALDPWTVAVNSAAAATNTNATEAEADAVTANTKAGEAAASATTASTAATTASSAATTATTKAGEASASATAAAASATTASSAASTAAASVSATLTAAVAASATTATNAATSATASATAAANSASSAAAIVLGVSTGHPTIRPSLNLDFANSQTVDPRITFTRASTATYYDGKTFAKAEENLLIYSQEFDNAAWSKGANVTVTANGATAPDGTTTADVFSTSDGVDGSVNRISSGNAGSTGDHTFSIWMRSSTTQSVIMRGLQSNGGTLVGSTVASVTSTWTRFTYTFNVTTASPRVSIGPNGAALSNIEIWGAQLEQRSAVTAYTPTTTAPITRYVPKLMTAISGAPRIDYDPVTLACKGLLIEEARTNLILRSEEFDNASWAKINFAVIANAATALDGVVMADKVVVNDTISSTGAYLSQGVTKAATATTYTLSYYAKAAEKGGLRVYIRDSATSANFANAAFNLITGAVSVAASTGGTFTAASATPATDCGNGWYRCTLTFTSGTETNLAIRPIVLNSDGTSFTGDGTSGIYIWGAQLEAGAFPTSYIPTTTAAATRAAENASMTGTNFSSWYRQDEGTFVIATAVIDIAEANARLLCADGGLSSSNIRFAGASFQVIDGAGTTQCSLGAVAMSNGVFSTLDGAYKLNDFAMSKDGATALTDTSGTVPTVDRLTLMGSSAAGTTCGWIKSMRYYPKRLSNAELQTITAA